MTVTINPAWLDPIRADAVQCEALRHLTLKPELTGTISEAAALYLRAIVDAVKPAVCIEVGTFIGTSALVLAATGARVYTCDKDNAAFMGTETITCYQNTGSTAMLTHLAEKHIHADLFFFDGRIQPDDLPLIRLLSHTRTVYAFDDYEGRAKGVVNVGRLRPQLGKGYRLVEPPSTVLDLPSHTTIAMLVPKGRW
jgi:hypothetical protein